MCSVYSLYTECDTNTERVVVRTLSLFVQRAADDEARLSLYITTPLLRVASLYEHPYWQHNTHNSLRHIQQRAAAHRLFPILLGVALVDGILRRIRRNGSARVERDDTGVSIYYHTSSYYRAAAGSDVATCIRAGGGDRLSAASGGRKRVAAEE